MSRKLWIGGGAAVGLIVVVGAVWFLFFSGDAPDAVSTEAGLEQLQEDLALTTDDADADDGDNGTDDPDPDDSDNGTDDADPSSAPPADPVNGTWIVDDEFGSFDFETASGSFAGFRVTEELTIGQTVAVGRSGGVTGSLTITDGTLTEAEITIAMTTIVSDRSRRENAIRSAVGANEFPTSTFVLTQPVELEAGVLEAGGTVSIDAVGELTIKGTTNEVTFAMEATIAEVGVGLVIGSTSVIWDDFGVDKPTAAIVVSIADEGIVEFQLVIRQG